MFRHIVRVRWRGNDGPAAHPAFAGCRKAPDGWWELTAPSGSAARQWKWADETAGHLRSWPWVEAVIVTERV